MSVIATISVPAGDFALEAVLGANPGVRVRLERVVPVGDTFVPYLWASNESVDEIEAELRQETDIVAFDVVDELEDEVLVRIDWAEEVDGLLGTLARTNASILDGVGEQNGWRLQLRFDDHDQLTGFYRQCAEEGIAVDLESVHNPGMPRGIGSTVGLTNPQREALELALERGYFAVPREASVVELAAELGISDSATSQRLRRGIATVLETTLPEVENEGARTR